MTDWSAVPTFGRNASPETAIVRPSAYGLITDDRTRLAIVRTPSGVYLPGGGIDAGEAPEATVAREIREECGLVVQLEGWRRMAIEFVFSAAERTHFAKHCTFCNGRAIGKSETDPEADHTLEWANAADAATRVTPASHRWAIEQWLATMS
jgi:8-oxo-dGTP diphosphatase